MERTPADGSVAASSFHERTIPHCTLLYEHLMNPVVSDRTIAHRLGDMRALKRLLGLWAGAALAGVAAALWAAGRTRPVPDRDVAPDPPPGLPPGRVVAVAGHGEMFVREDPGPTPGAPCVLLLHGWMFPADMHWFRSYGALARLARVIAVDHRGHGRGSRPAKPFRLADVADDAAALVRELGTGPVVAVGYSMGGPIAQLLWQRHPDVVCGLVLCATSATFNVRPTDRWLWRTMGLLQVFMRLLPRHLWDALPRVVVDQRLPLQLTQLLDVEAAADIEQLLPWMIGEVDRGSAEDIAEAGRELSRFDARGWLPTVDVPTAVVITRRDTLVPVDNQRDLVARLGPDGADRVYELDVDHDAMITRTAEFVPALTAAVRDVITAPRQAVDVRSGRPSS
jgi:pimeloyl-ACP methyl ester carboxylesterase